jgi:hypothetical protein
VIGIGTGLRRWGLRSGDEDGEFKSLDTTLGGGAGAGASGSSGGCRFESLEASFSNFDLKFLVKTFFNRGHPANRSLMNMIPC